MTRFMLLRRLAVFVLAILVLCAAGLGLLLFRWHGNRGAPPTGRLYVNGEFSTAGPLVVLGKAATGSACYDVEVPGHEEARVCRGKPERVWVEDALLHLSVGARGVPRVSVAGLRVREGDLIGSVADRRRPHPRFPIRAYGVPAVAARSVPCLRQSTSRESTGPCLEIRDRGGRVALARSGDGHVEVPRFGERRTLSDGDVLWLGLVAFEAAVEDGGTLVLQRVDRLRPRRTGSGPRALEMGGDRRWLGRLWHVETPDPGPEVPERFEIHPMRRRYTTHHLSRQRTNFEGEDVLQRLIDGGWLCFEGGQVVWRPLDAPGCGATAPSATAPSATAPSATAPSATAPSATAPSAASPGSGVTRTALHDYQRARYGDLSFLAGSLVGNANAALVEASYLEDATALPLAFDWRLAYRGEGEARDGRPPQPVPRRLWGVRFGATRQIRRSVTFHQGLLPTVVPRSSTARHVVRLFQGEDLRTSFYMAGDRGSICLGDHPRDGRDSSFRDTSGVHHPLGSVAFGDNPLEGTWSPDPGAGCEGCRLDLEVTEDGSLAFGRTGDCGFLETGLGEDEIRWGPYRLSSVDRGRPWLAATDPGTRRRHFAEELYLQGGLRPLLGDEAGLSGVEAALREVLRDAGEVGVRPGFESLELTIDGDLQLAAAAIVDALARRHITDENDPDPDGVSVTAAVLDARSGDLLAAVNWSRAGSVRARASDWARPTSWELGSGQADVLENAALLRRGAVGSTLKIAGAYALLNNGLTGGAELASERRGYSFLEAGGERGQIELRRGGRRSVRRCSTGPHFLPATGRAFTAETFVGRFAESCNNFFVLSGFRHAGHEPAELRIEIGPGRRAALVEPERPLADRIREGLGGDYPPPGGSGETSVGSPALPRSLYGVLLRLGFQPRPGLFAVRGEAPAELAFDRAGGRVTIPLVHDWFSPTGEAATPALEPGRDFAYLGLPSPGRLDDSTQGEGVTEHYDGEPRRALRGPDEGRSEVQYSMLMIGQSSVEVSAVGLASLFAPAARSDGRAVSPCLFRRNCGESRAGARVIGSADAGNLNEALRAVVRRGTARGGLTRIGLAELPARGWGGKTGTYEVERRDPVGLARDEWRRLRAWACGVEGVERPRFEGFGSVRSLVSRLRAAGPGSALGGRTCEEPDLPFNPAGIHHYRDDSAAADLDALARELERTAEKKTEVFHSFVALVPPERGNGWPAAGNPARGIVVAVLVDRETEDEKSLAVLIGGELAAAVERWASLARDL